MSLLSWIFKGSAPNDKTGTPARLAADMINNNFAYLEDRIINIENPDGVLKSGNIDTDGLNVDVAADAFEWQIDQIKFSDTPDFHAVLDAATDGYYRKDVLLGNNMGGYNIFKGEEDPTSATEPNLFPNGTIKLGVIDVYGALISGSIPVDVSGKEDKANKNQPNGYAGLDGAGKIYNSQLPVFNSDNVAEGALNKYSTLTLVMSYILTGISFSTGTSIVATDTILSAFGKLQKQISDNVSAVSLKQVKDEQIEISSNGNVQNSWHGQTILFTANCVITVPAALNNSLMFPFRTLSGVTVTWAITSPFVWETTPATTTEKTTGHFMRRGSTNTIFLDM